MKRYEFLVEKYVSASLMDAETFTRIVMADPTTLPGNPPKVGKYVSWLIRCYTKSRSKQSFMDHLPQTTLDLKKFHTHKGVVPTGDINQIRSVQELYKKVKHYRELDVLPKKQRREELLKRYARKVYEDDRYDVYIPLTVDAARELGGPPLTNWCTNEGMYFRRYTRNGPLYIIRDKHQMVKWGSLLVPQPICQFHFETLAFYNEQDNDYDYTLLLHYNKGLADFFFDKFRKSLHRFKVYRYVREYNSYFALYGITDQDRKMIRKQVIQWAKDRDDYLNLSLSDFEVVISVFGFDATMEMIINHLPKSMTNITIENDSHFKSSGKLPDRLYRLKGLVKLKIINCLESFPDISQLQKLSVLSLRKNKLKSISEDIYKLKRLQLLDLTDNPITEKIESSTFLIIK